MLSLAVGMTSCTALGALESQFKGNAVPERYICDHKGDCVCKRHKEQQLPACKNKMLQ